MTEITIYSDEKAKEIMNISRWSAGTLFRTLDTDGDGVLSEAEIEAAPKVLKSLDSNGDGYLRESDFGGPTHVHGQIRRSGLVRVLDADGDLIIGPDDIADASARILELDRDGDGRVTAHDDLPPPGANFTKPIPMGTPSQNLEFQEKLFSRQSGITGPKPPVGDSNVQSGYLLVHEVNDRGDVQKSSRTLLLDEFGKMVHEWPAKNRHSEATVSYLLDDGNLLRTSTAHSWISMDGKFPIGANGTLSLHDKDGEVIWEWTNLNWNDEVLHHDIEVMPNGNILLICYDIIGTEDAQSKGWKKQFDREFVALEKIYEIKPDFASGTCETIWEWSIRDHLIQDTDPNLPNFGAPTEHPEKIDINWLQFSEQLFNSGQMFHMNSISYNSSEDIIIVSTAMFGEIWVIDHSTTTEEAASSSGGLYGKGGDILWRWGNPQTHSNAGSKSQKLFWPHNVYFLPNDVPHRGDVMIFNNGLTRGADGLPEGDQICMGLVSDAYTDVLELQLPRTKEGKIDSQSQPKNVWSFNDDGSKNFYSPFMSGAQRMHNGNTLMVQGCDKRIVEVNENGEILMDFHIGGPGRMHRILKYRPDHPGIKALGL